MNNKLQKIRMVIVSIVLFAGIILLSVEKNEQQQWRFAIASTFAQGESGESGDGGSGAQSILIVENGTSTKCVGNKSYSVLSYSISCIGDGNLPCVSGNYEKYTENGSCQST